jgi:hypothetical protein
VRRGENRTTHLTWGAASERDEESAVREGRRVPPRSPDGWLSKARISIKLTECEF